MNLTIFIAVFSTVFGEIELLHRNCSSCERFHTCTDLAAQTYRHLALYKANKELSQGKLLEVRGLFSTLKKVGFPPSTFELSGKKN